MEIVDEGVPLRVVGTVSANEADHARAADGQLLKPSHACQTLALRVNERDRSRTSLHH